MRCTYEAQLRAGSEGGTSFSADLSGEGGRPRARPRFRPDQLWRRAGRLARRHEDDRITNRGNYPGGAFIAVIAGGAIGSFHLLDENCTGIPLSPEASCTLLVNFQPLSTGVKTARLGLFGDSTAAAR